MTQPSTTESRFIRPSDRLAPEDYPEWLQRDARYHAPPRWREALVRIALGVGMLGLAIALVASLAAWRDFVQDAPTPFGGTDTPVAP